MRSQVFLLSKIATLITYTLPSFENYQKTKQPPAEAGGFE